MSTYLHDVADEAILGLGLPPQTVTSTVTGSTQDLLAGDGPCVAYQQVGAVSGTTPSLAGKIQESADGTTWTDIAASAFTAVTASNNFQAVSFERTQRYL